MTSPQDRNAEPNDPATQSRPRKADDGHELDAEVVRDLELDGQAEDVRGGSGGAKSCPHEH